jgi:hypothetical protein
VPKQAPWAESDIIASMENFYRKWHAGIRKGDINPIFEYAGVVGFRDDNTISGMTMTSDQSPIEVNPLSMPAVKDILIDPFDIETEHFIEFHNHPSAQAAPSGQDLSVIPLQIQAWREQTNRVLSDDWIIGEDPEDSILSTRMDTSYRIDDAGVKGILRRPVIQRIGSIAVMQLGSNHNEAGVVIALAAIAKAWGNDPAWKQIDPAYLDWVTRKSQQIKDIYKLLMDKLS